MSVQRLVRECLQGSGVSQHVVNAAVHHVYVRNLDFGEQDREGTEFTVPYALDEDSIKLVLRGMPLRPGAHFTTSVADGVTTIDTSDGTDPFGAPGTEGQFWLQEAEVIG